MEASRIRAVLLLAALAVVQARETSSHGCCSPVRCRASKSSARDDWIPHDLKPLQANGDVQSKFVGDCFATINPTQGREGIWDGEVPRAQQLRILQEAYTALNNHNMVEFQLEQSVQNCHWMGVYSIRVTPLLRAFIPEENQDDVGLYDNSRPHDHNDRFVMHNHRHDLISLPLSGHQENIKYDETDDHDDDLYVGTYLKAKFYSALFQEDRKAKQVEVGSVKLKRTSYTVNQPWHMDAREIHRIMWQVVDGVPVIALLKEVRDPDAINKQPADWNLPLKASEFPCASHLELYQKLGRDDCIRLRRLLSDAVQASINSLNSVLCVVHSSRSHMKSSRSSFWYNSG